MAGNVSWQRLSGARYPLSSALMPDDVPPDRSLRLMCDYSAPPLWNNEGGVTDFAEYGLPADLERDLWAWQEHFDANFHWETGWSDESAAQLHDRVGRDLLTRLSDALPGYVVELDLWAVRGPRIQRWVRETSEDDEIWA